MFSRSQSDEVLYVKNESPGAASPDHLSGVDASPTSVHREDNKDGIEAMDAKRYALRWRHHQSTVVAEVGYLYRDAALVDVTLACEDQRTYQAHKLVLSACSQYFQTLFSRHPAHQHPIIFLKDVCGDECEALLTYMYRGEVSVNQEQIPRILRVASSLQVRGLAEVETPNSRTSSPVERSTHCLSLSPSPSATHAAKCITPLSEPQSPNEASNSVTPHSTHHANNPTTENNNISSSVRHMAAAGAIVPPPPPPPSHSSGIGHEISPYHHLFPQHRPPYDPIAFFGPLAEHERKRVEEKASSHSTVGPYHPPLRVKKDLTGSNWDGNALDIRGLSPLSLTEGGSRPPFLPPNLFSSLINQEQHLPTVPQGYGRIFSISDPIRRVDRLCTTTTTGSDPRIHKCQFCSRKFKRKDHLKTHVRIHTGERPYKCKICGRGFIQSQQVKIHMKVHLREDTSGGMSSSLLSGAGPPETRALSALYPELNPPHFSNEKDFRSSKNGKYHSSVASPQDSGPIDSENEEFLESVDDLENEPSNKGVLRPPFATSPSSSNSIKPDARIGSAYLQPHSPSNSSGNGLNNNNNNPNKSNLVSVNHSGIPMTTTSPQLQAMDVASSDDMNILSPLKERRTPSPYPLSASLKK